MKSLTWLYLSQKTLPTWTDGFVIEDAPANQSFKYNCLTQQLFPLGKQLLVRRQTNIVLLMILLEEDCALARSVVSSLQDCQWHMLQQHEMTMKHRLRISQDGVGFKTPSVRNAG